MEAAQPNAHLLPGRLLRQPNAPEPIRNFGGVQIDDPRLVAILPPDTPLLTLHEGMIHAEGAGLARFSPSPTSLGRAEPPPSRLV